MIVYGWNLSLLESIQISVYQNLLLFVGDVWNWLHGAVWIQRFMSPHMIQPQTVSSLGRLVSCNILRASVPYWSFKLLRTNDLKYMWDLLLWCCLLGCHVPPSTSFRVHVFFKKIQKSAVWCSHVGLVDCRLYSIRIIPLQSHFYVELGYTWNCIVWSCL